MSADKPPMTLNVQEIQKLLAHRYPFYLIDRITDVQLDKSIKGYKNLTMNEEIFQGHFPGNPIFPGVMVIEAMAQLSGVLGFVTMHAENIENMLYLLAGVDKVRFKRPTIPGDRLDLEATLLQRKRSTWKFNTIASVDGEFVASAEILCVVSEA